MKNKQIKKNCEPCEFAIYPDAIKEEINKEIIKSLNKELNKDKKRKLNTKK